MGSGNRLRFVADDVRIGGRKWKLASALWGLLVLFSMGGLASAQEPSGEQVEADGEAPPETVAEARARARAEIRDRPTDHLSGREPDPNPIRAFVEEAFVVGVGTAYYWLDKDKNAVDWDYDSWGQRFHRSAFRFDNNHWQINWIWHPFAGSAYHTFARANDLSAGWAFVFDFTTSFAWEWLFEFKERVSINDQIATPVTGFVLGEFWYKLGRWLHVQATTRPRRAAAWTLGLPVQAHEAMDGDTPTQAERDALHATFRLGYGPALIFGDADTAPIHSLQFEGEIVELPAWSEPRRVRQVFHDANITSLRSRATRGPGGTGGSFELFADSVVVGLHAQNRDELGGATATVGMALGYTHWRYDYAGFDDRVAAAHLPGFALDGSIAHGRATFRFSLRGYPDFASTDARAPYEAWAVQSPDQRTKTILEREGYFFGWGGTGRAMVALEIGPFELGFRTGIGRWTSQEDLDRSQEELTFDVEVDAQRYYTEAWARVQLPYGLHIDLRYDELRRFDVVGGFGQRQILRRAGLAFGVLR